MRAMGDGDDGDEGRVRLLTRRAESLRRQIAEASEAMSQPQRRERDGVEAAASRAGAALAEVTRSQVAGARPVPQERPLSAPSPVAPAVALSTPGPAAR
jgi:septal ring factor EnvC (AmiA/AmiB activator)